MSKRTSRLGHGLLAARRGAAPVAGTVSAAPGEHQAAATRSGSGRTRTARRPSRRSSARGPRRRGVNVDVVQKDFGKIRDDLKTVQPDTAPDVIVGAHDWTGQLAADGLVLPLIPRKAARGRSSRRTRSTRSPTAPPSSASTAPRSRVENIGLVVNTKLAKVPTTFAQLQTPALAFKKKKSGNLAIAVQQGAAATRTTCIRSSRASCGYVFGTNKAGNLDPSDIGVANTRFLVNAQA